MRQQNPLTLVTPIDKEKLHELYSCLENLKKDLEAGVHELFQNTNNIHYLRWVIIDDEKSPFFKGDKHAPKLVFSSNFDGKVDDHINGMCTESEALIDEIYGCCEDYPVADKGDVTTRIQYLNKWKVKTSAFYTGARGRTVEQILNEDELRDHLRSLLNKKDWSKMRPLDIHRSLKEQVFSDKKFSWITKSYKMPSIYSFNMFLLVISIIILLPAIIGILLPVIIVWVLIVQYGYERKDEYFTMTRSGLDEKKVEVLETYEDLGKEDQSEESKDPIDKKTKAQMFYQNQFTQLVDMKEGKVRLITFNALMLLARILIPTWFVKGKLMNIPTIHFARWVLFDDNKRVLFFSNFDGSWQQYLGDFIDQSGWGLTGIFSNTKNFPKTRFLFTGGAYDEEHFLAWSRNSELSTQIWYSAYPDLSIKNVNNNSRLRVLLSKDLSNKGAKKFLKLI